MKIVNNGKMPNKNLHLTVKSVTFFAIAKQRLFLRQLK